MICKGSNQKHIIYVRYALREEKNVNKTKLHDFKIERRLLDIFKICKYIINILYVVFIARDVLIGSTKRFQFQTL